MVARTVEAVRLGSIPGAGADDRPASRLADVSGERKEVVAITMIRDGVLTHGERVASHEDRMRGIMVGDRVRVVSVASDSPLNEDADAVEEWVVVSIDTNDPRGTFGVRRLNEEGVVLWAYQVEPLFDEQDAYLTVGSDLGPADTKDARLGGIEVGDEVLVIRWWQGRFLEAWTPEQMVVVEAIDRNDVNLTFKVRNPATGEVRWAHRVYKPLPTTQTQASESGAEQAGRVYTDEEIEQIRREVRAEMQRRSDTRLAEFKQSIVEKVLEKQSENDWCDAGVEEALEELGLELPRRDVEVRFTVTVRMSGVSPEMYRRVRDDDESWVESSLTIEAFGDNDCGDVEVAYKDLEIMSLVED